MLYSAGQTDDLRVALMYIQKRFPKAPLLGIGFSLGANVLARYVAEEGDQCRLNSGCAVGSVRRTLLPRSAYLKLPSFSLGTCLRIINGK